MNEQDIRALVRDAIERHLGRPGEGTRGPAQGARGKGQGANLRSPSEAYPSPLTPYPYHSSHIILEVVPGSEIDEGMCLIEPAVRCNHCGFCQSYGH